MSTFIFNIACPRCDTAVKIFLDKSEYNCSRCQFKVVVEDKDNLLLAFKNKEVEDLDFSESPIREAGSHMDSGIKLSFSKAIEDVEEESAGDKKGDVEIDEDEFGNKTANTQIIQLTFDPAKYLDEMKNASARQKGKKKKISLKKVIKNAESAKPPVPSNQQVTMRNITLVVIIVLLIIMVIYLINR